VPTHPLPVVSTTGLLANRPRSPEGGDTSGNALCVSAFQACF